MVKATIFEVSQEGFIGGTPVETFRFETVEEAQKFQKLFNTVNSPGTKAGLNYPRASLQMRMS